MWHSGKDHLLNTIFRERIVVTLKDGQSFRGLYDGADNKHLTLIDAEYLKPEAVTKVDGKVFLPRDHIAFMQRP
ncbi:MAG: hypothetical protein ACXV5Q_00745 [Frankiaceae bacterium]